MSTGPDARPATLVVLAGLPGVGKTTLARAVARDLPAALLRVDAIEGTLRRLGAARSEGMGVTGYAVAAAVAREQLLTGGTVIIDAVNPVEAVRETWRELAASTFARLRVVEVVCSDRVEHRSRVETRVSDLPGGHVPSWQEVLDRWYEPWTEPRLVLDSATVSVLAGAATVTRYLRATADDPP